MAGPTPIRKHRPKHVKLATVMAAEIAGITETAKQTGIPHQTISYWMERPEFGEYRRRAREDMADEIGVVAHLAWERVAEALRAGTLEPRDALFAADKATTLHQLVTGGATSRSENRELNDLPDSAYVDAIREAERLLSSEGTAAQTEDPATR